MAITLSQPTGPTPPLSIPLAEGADRPLYAMSVDAVIEGYGPHTCGGKDDPEGCRLCRMWALRREQQQALRKSDTCMCWPPRGDRLTPRSLCPGCSPMG